MEPDFVEDEYFAFIEQIKIQQDPGNRRSDKVVDEQSPRKPYFTKVIFQDFKVVFNGRPTRAVGYSKNISVGGLFIYFFHEIPVGERITVKFEIPNGKSVHILEAQAEVRWLKEIDPQRERLPGIGIKLINLKKEDEEVIQKYIDSI